MRKKLLSLILAVVLIASTLPSVPVFASTVWDGTTKDVPILENGAYQIGTAEQLAWFSEETKTKSDINAVLTDDINLGGKPWSPIGMPASGYVTEAYSGTFDGQGHTVSGLYINTSSAFWGMFYCVYGGTVKNLNVNGDVTTTGNTAGGIVGKLQGGTIENCSFDGSVTAKGNYVGGIAANIVSNSKIASNIIGCYNSGEINGKYAGGILGYTTAKANISSCYNKGTINGTTRSAGISGQQTTGAISYCYNIGSSASGISGFSNAVITNCYYLNDETTAPGGTASGYEKITDKAQLLRDLNAGDDKLFAEDNKNKNDGYPVLSWQTSSSSDVETPIEKPENPDNTDDNKSLENILNDMQWNFKQLQPVYGEDTNMIVKFQNLLKSKGYDGITVTVKSTADESLVSKNGKIYYPAIDENSYANGKQVKVFFNLTVDDKTVVYPTTDNYSLLIPWDTSSVKSSLETSADTILSETEICSGNDSFSCVSTNLNLPSCIRGDKYSFAWITWESSDNKHLSISDENRQGSADALYNAYVGKVYRDHQEHNVTLTATITNPSTNVTIKRVFDVTVNPLSDEELNQTLDKMNAALNCYTADKLTDSATKKQIDINAVDNDIQLVIPSKVVNADELADIDYGKYWDYWNYKFTVSSSDTEVIEINSFRAYVYRPLGENSSADKMVTLTVKMASKANPNLFVTKDITVTVKHLCREDINAQLDLMDQAKDNYAKGLLGNNADTYSIIDNLSPYQEIVWNDEKSGVDFIRTHSDVRGNGIIVDTLPDWEDQEDWRLFRTSDKDLISNETLILNKTPQENTFVKINSVLSDETLGKYYTKFCNNKNYDVEALAKFKQLYKQPVSAYVMAVGESNYTESFATIPADLKANTYSAKLSAFKKELDKPISITFTLLGLDGESLIAKTTETSFTKGATVFDVFKKMIADNNMYYNAKGSYISAVNGLAECDYGSNSGWMYTVGDVFVNSYMNAQELSGGEDIVVMYVKDYTLANKAVSNNDNQNNNDNNNDNQNNKPNNSQNSNNNQNQNNNTQNNSDNNSKPDSDSNTEKSDTESETNNSNKSDPSSDSKADNSNGKQNTDEPKADKADDNENEEQNDAGISEGEILSGKAKDSTKAEPEKKKSNTALVISIVAAIVCALAAILIAIQNRKKKNK